MFEVRGKYAGAKIFATTIEQEAIAQIINMCNQPFMEGSQVRIMPDVHAGKGCVIGTTLTIKDRVVPNLVGVDIGCGMYTVNLGQIATDMRWLEEFDTVVQRVVPFGVDIRKTVHRFTERAQIGALRCQSIINKDRARYSIGTLGGGNHFIELNRGSDGSIYLVIHSGSRNLGKQVAEYYQKLAIEATKKSPKSVSPEIIADLKAKGQANKIAELFAHKESHIPPDLAYVEGQLFTDYMHDMRITQEYADLNRKAMANEILSAMRLDTIGEFTTVHNYIDGDNMILRKGAVAAYKDQVLLIPINMRDGSLICRGKGNADYNYSAPHGAGRLMSRSQAKATLDLKEFEREMAGVYSTTVGSSTLDEAPMAYKPIDEILSNIGDTVDVIDTIKPIYNFKAT